MAERTSCCNGRGNPGTTTAGQHSGGAVQKTHTALVSQRPQFPESSTVLDEFSVLVVNITLDVLRGLLPDSSGELVQSCAGLVGIQTAVTAGCPGRTLELAHRAGDASHQIDGYCRRTGPKRLFVGKLPPGLISLLSQTSIFLSHEGLCQFICTLLAVLSDEPAYFLLGSGHHALHFQRQILIPHPVHGILLQTLPLFFAHSFDVGIILLLDPRFLPGCKLSIGLFCLLLQSFPLFIVPFPVMRRGGINLIVFIKVSKGLLRPILLDLQGVNRGFGFQTVFLLLLHINRRGSFGGFLVKCIRNKPDCIRQRRLCRTFRNLGGDNTGITGLLGHLCSCCQIGSSIFNILA